jgi:hypothetical protein
MACVLRPDTSPGTFFDAETVAGTTATLFVRVQAAAPPPIRVVSAGVNNSPLPVDNSGPESIVRLAFRTAGTYFVDLVVVGTSVGDHVELLEACGGPQVQVLTSRRVGQAPGGPNPLLSFTFHAR